MAGAVGHREDHGVAAGRRIALRHRCAGCRLLLRAVAEVPVITHDPDIVGGGPGIEGHGERCRTPDGAGGEGCDGRSPVRQDGDVPADGSTQAAIVGHLQRNGMDARLGIGSLQGPGRRQFQRSAIAEIPAVKLDLAVVTRGRRIECGGERLVRDNGETCAGLRIRRRCKASRQCIGTHAAIARVTGDRRIALTCARHFKVIEARSGDLPADGSTEVLRWITGLQHIASGIPQGQDEVGIGADRCRIDPDIEQTHSRPNVEDVCVGGAGDDSVEGERAAATCAL